MVKNTALRELIVRSAMKNGGFTTTVELRAAAIGAGFPPREVAAVDRYALALCHEGVMRRAGKGRYGHVGTLDFGAYGILARIPFGTHFYGRILFHMVSHRFVSAKDVYQALRAQGCAIAQARVSNALFRLRARGYVRSTGTRMFTLSTKTLEALGLRRESGDTECAPSAIAQATPHIMAMLRTEPPKRVRDMSRALATLGIDIDAARVHRIVRHIAKRHRVERTGFGTYRLIDTKEDACARTTNDGSSFVTSSP